MHIHVVTEEPILLGEWFYDENPETSLKPIRKNLGPIPLFGAGYYLIRASSHPSLGLRELHEIEEDVINQKYSPMLVFSDVIEF